ncbi:MAG: GlcNAc-transferase family protein [Nitrosarchaeum sp.]|jgi:hypothetical protein|nr:GlcNAc-transferase family protein [Nitrosarchaeum sp.]
MNIFVSVCSYQDPLLPHTIKSMMQTKSNRNNVVYSIFEQTRYEDSLACTEPVLVSRDDVIYKRIDPEYSDGCVWARYINMLNITNEYDFIYQVDSHILHDMNWDRALIEDYKRAMDMCDTNKVIITGSCKSFVIQEKDGEIKTYPRHEENDACQVKYYTIDPDTLIPDVHGDVIPSTDMPRPAFHIMAGNFFTHVDWIDNVGLDPKVFFVGEEVMMTMMSYAAGYKMFHHSKMVSYHLEDTVNWHTKTPPEDQKAARRREILSEIGRWQWKHYLEACREDLLSEFHQEFGVDFINLDIEERARTYSLDVVPGKVDVLAISKKPKKKVKMPKTLFINEDEE